MPCNLHHTEKYIQGSIQAIYIAGEGESESSEGTTQGDPLAMAMCALAIKPLNDRLRNSEPNARQVWFADDVTAAGRLATLHKWWQLVTTIGPEFRYNPNASKTHLVVKPKLLEKPKKSSKTLMCRCPPMARDIWVLDNRVHGSLCSTENYKMGERN